MPVKEEEIHVGIGDTIQWSIDTSQVGSGIGLLVTFGNSNSNDSNSNRRFWPFKEAPPKTEASKQTPDQEICAIEFKTETSAFTVKPDPSVRATPPRGKADPLPVVYNYRLWAFVPADLTPDKKGNCHQSAEQWPNVKVFPTTSTEYQFLVVTSDPEVWVDEC